MRFATRAIHAGNEPDPTTGSVTVPIYQTATYVQEALGKHKGFEYARTQNPTRSALERNLAALESGRAALAFASGMAAINALVQAMLQAGDHVIVSNNTYGGTFRLFDYVSKKWGVSASYVDTSHMHEVESAILSPTRMIFVETPTNPTMRLTDLAETARLARAHSLKLAVDNTFMSPYFQRPIEFGADIVVHSTTKYLNGHSDGVGGVVVLAHDEDAEKLGFIQNAAGAIISPFDAWLVLRGTKTLALRMRQHDENGRAVAAFLSDHPAVDRVYYPGVTAHPQHELARRQMSGFGGMVAFETGSLNNAAQVLSRVKLCSLAESLGGVETLISHPATMTHAIVPPEVRRKLGITDGLVRISVGCEDVADIIDDLDQALRSIV